MSNLREPQPDSGVSREQAGRAASEADLLARIRRGDDDAFDAVARQYGPRLFALALRLTGRREDAEDLVQETLVRTLPKLAGFEGRAKLSTYLVQALSNQWKNRLRSRQRSRLVGWFRLARGGEDEPSDDVAVDPSPSAEERLEAEDRAEAVRAAIERLAPERRLALILREVEGMPYEEIAAATGVPVGTVRSRIARARDDLRRLLGGSR